MPVAAEKLQNPEWGPAEHTNALRFARADLKILDLLPDELSQFRLTPADIAAPFGLDPEDRGNVYISEDDPDTFSYRAQHAFSKWYPHHAAAGLQSTKFQVTIP